MNRPQGKSRKCTDSDWCPAVVVNGHSACRLPANSHPLQNVQHRNKNTEYHKYNYFLFSVSKGASRCSAAEQYQKQYQFDVKSIQLKNIKLLLNNS